MMRSNGGEPLPARVSYQPLAWLAQFSDEPAEKQAAEMALAEIDQLRRLIAADVRKGQ